jgi:peroxiredoxin
VSQAQSRTARAPAPTDTPAPPPLASLGRFEDFDEPSSAGNYVRLSAVQGRATVVTFWSPRSTRSRDQLLPVLPLYQTLKGKGLAVVGVSMDPDTDRIKEALDDITLPWPQVADHSGLARRYHVDAKAGEVFVLDASRNIVAAGPMGANIVNAVRQLLKAQ